jgi:preprotein translocase subunit SecA
MNKWTNANNNAECYCSSHHGLFVPNRQLSLIVSGFLFLGFAIFITGYFFGKKTITQEYTRNVQEQAVSDKIYTSVLTGAQETLPDNNFDIRINTSENSNPDDTQLEHSIKKQYYAQLIGFCTEKSAQKFVQKLASKGIETEIKKRKSKTAKGKVSYWYQVVTSFYSDKDELIALVQRISQEENIKGTSIQVC